MNPSRLMNGSWSDERNEQRSASRSRKRESYNMNEPSSCDLAQAAERKERRDASVERLSSTKMGTHLADLTERTINGFYTSARGRRSDRLDGLTGKEILAVTEGPSPNSWSPGITLTPTVEIIGFIGLKYPRLICTGRVPMGRFWEEERESQVKSSDLDVLISTNLHQQDLGIEREH